ncbi:MAG: M24 family metallopeptidase [Planctomycetota bacterium]
MSRGPVRTPADADAAFAAGQRVVEVHRRLVDFVRVGHTLAEVDAFVASTLADLGCRSCFLHYRPSFSLPPFPSHACLSVNDCVVHGTAASLPRPLEPGDLLKIDIGVVYKGWIGDAAWTYSMGEPTAEVRKLMDAGKKGLRLGIEQLRPGNTYFDWADALQTHVEEDCGFHLIEGLGGHGIGRNTKRDPGLHLPPFVPNTRPRGYSPRPNHRASNPLDVICEAGTLVAVEPMIAIGTGATHSPNGPWPIHSRDGSLAVHHEHDVLITESGPRVMTEGLDDLPDVLG